MMGNVLFANYLGRSASMMESGWKLFTHIKNGNWGTYRDITDGITGGADDNVIGCISELGVDLATMAIPLPLQIIVNLTRGFGEFFIGKDTADAAMYATQALAGGDPEKACKVMVDEWKTAKGIVSESAKKVKNLTDMDYKPLISHLSSRAGTLTGNIHKDITPWLDIIIKAFKPAHRLAFI